MDASITTDNAKIFLSVIKTAIASTSKDVLEHEDFHELLPIYNEHVAVLTELLNTDCVRSDEGLLRQVQEQLMEAQQNCRRQRQGTPSLDKRELAYIISDQLKLELQS